VRIVRTVLGDIPPEELGVTDSHDHLIRTGGQEVRDDIDFLMDSVDKAVEEMNYFIEAGGKSLIAMDPIGCGRNVPMMLEVAKRLEGRAHIVMSTGFHKGEFYDNRMHWLATCDIDKVAEMLVAEIQVGMDKHSYNGPIVERVSAKAGVIKSGTSYSVITPFEQRQIEAVALTHKATGVPIVTHTQMGTMALETVELYKKRGVSPERIALSHVQKNPDFYYHKRVLATGAYICYDGPDRVKYYTDETQAKLIAALVEAGYQKQILLSMDAGRASYQTAHSKGIAHGIAYMLTDFVPLLREVGVKEDAIEDILINNPARFFSFEPVS